MLKAKNAIWHLDYRGQKLERSGSGQTAVMVQFFNKF